MWPHLIHLPGGWNPDPDSLHLHWIYTLWWTNILPWKITIFYGKIHYKWPFSIAMLVHQRVCPNCKVSFPSNPMAICQASVRKALWQSTFNFSFHSWDVTATWDQLSLPGWDKPWVISHVPIFHITQPWSVPVYGLLDGYYFRWCPIFPSHGTFTNPCKLVSSTAVACCRQETTTHVMQRDLHIAKAHIEAMLSLDEKNLQVKLNGQRHEHPDQNDQRFGRNWWRLLPSSLMNLCILIYRIWHGFMMVYGWWWL